MTRVVRLEDYLDYARQLPCMQTLAERVSLDIDTTKAISEAEIVDRVRDADIIVTIRDRVVYSASLLSQMGHVQLLSVCGTRLSHIDLAAATQAGVLICAPTAAAQGTHQNGDSGANLESHPRPHERHGHERPSRARGRLADVAIA